MKLPQGARQKAEAEAATRAQNRIKIGKIPNYSYFLALLFQLLSKHIFGSVPLLPVATIVATGSSFIFVEPILGTRIEVYHFHVPLLRRSSQQGYFAKRNKTNIEYYFEYKQNSYRATRDHTQRTVATEFLGIRRRAALSPRPIGSCSLFGASPLAPPHRQLLFLRRCLSRSAPSAAALC